MREQTPTMGDGWFVTVGRFGDSIVTIEDRCLSGKTDFTPDDKALIRGAARHLLAFIGDDTDLSALSARCTALEAKNKRFKEIGQGFERDYRNTFEQSCKNLERAEIAERRCTALARLLARLRDDAMVMDVAYPIIASVLSGDKVADSPVAEGPPWWCATCESWRLTQPCGRDECPTPEL